MKFTLILLAVMVASCDQTPAPASIDSAKNSPQSILDKLNAFAPLMVALLDEWEAAYPRISYKLLTTDVQKSNSLINPMVGVLRIQRNTTIDGLEGPSMIATITVAPLANNKWKCVSLHLDPPFKYGDPTSDLTSMIER